jgi:hypothetical protein
MRTAIAMRGMLNEVRARILAESGLPASARLSTDDMTQFRSWFEGGEWRETYFRRLTSALSPSMPVAHAAQRLAGLMSAAFEFDTAVLDLLLSARYKPESHRGDPFDHALFTQLADPGLTSVTADKRLALKVVQSPQRHRIIVWG